ncbi:MAG: transcription antitermination factor NusB [Porphyromonadaceae bacterium CG2_30_38_12]|nr:MAG: transcription antitermination factor NusB [Porphyromonadaceae bacterium CG2_30_38_12]
MINREIIRTKVIQTLYSYYKGNSKTPAMLEKELFHSMERTYDLYHLLLLLAVELTQYADTTIQNKRSKLRPTAEDLNPNLRFVQNAFVAQLKRNVQLNEHLQLEKLTWVNYPELIKSLYEQICASEFYVLYMEADAVDYAADKDIWRKIFTKIILQSEALDSAVEEQSIYWIDDFEIVLSFIIKTIKRFAAENEERQALLPMFKDDEDAEFARKLLQSVIKNSAEYLDLIDKNTLNWDLDRIAYMDILIMQVALCEINTFPTIPINVSLNEYIEVAKKYSTDRSGTFINGVLDNIVGQLKKDKKLIKVKTFDVKK